MSNVDKMLKEFAGNIAVGTVFLGQFQRDRQHIQAIHAHPTGAIGLLDMAAIGQWHVAIKDADIIQAQKATLEDILSLKVLAVHPPGEIEQQFLEDLFQESRDHLCRSVVALSCRHDTRPRHEQAG